MKVTNSIKIIPFGGLGAIGNNMTLFEYGDSIIVVDCGIMFPGEDMPGIDYVIPDFSYIRKNKHKIKGLVITHGHEDHIGAVPYFLQEVNVPIYATKLTLGLIQSRLQERPPKEDPVYHEVSPRDRIHIGSFMLEFIRVNHSIIDGVGLAIQTDVGTVIHSGDYKIDFSPVDANVTDIYRFADYGEKGVLLLMSDSTNAEREGFTKSESVLVKKLREIFSAAKGRVIVTTFASNIHRIQQVLDIAQRYNRKVVISGLTMLKNIEIATSMGYLKFKKDLIVDIKQANSLPNKRIVVIGTGSQGEPMSALSRIANGTHRHLVAQQGDTVIITASVIPGNERTVNTIINTLLKLGADVYYDQDEDIHVSGHGSTKELKLLLSVTKPKYFMPIHGEYKHLKAHSKIAESLNIKPANIIIADNGDVLELTSNSFAKTGTIPIAQMYVDGGEIGDINSSVIKDRHALSSEGLLVVAVTISEGFLLKDPVVISRGFVGDGNNKLMNSLTKQVKDIASRLLKDSISIDNLRVSLKRDLQKYINKSTKRDPVIELIVQEV